MWKSGFRSAAFVAAHVALAAPAMARSGQDASDPAAGLCMAAEARAIGFSGVVSIVRPEGSVSFVQGTRSGPGSAAIEPDTRFNLGSASKMFTAVAVAQLVDAGTVRLDDPIGRHVEGLTPEAATVTVRQLLTHSGGLGNFFAPENLPILRKAKSLTDLKSLVLHDKPRFSPGSGFEYSNSGFLLLGLMIEKVSGEAFADFLQRHVFAPAGMVSTGLQAGDPATLASGMTTLPDMSGGPPPPGNPPVPPPGGMPLPPGGLMLLPGGPPPSGPLRPAIEAALPGNSAGGSFSTLADMQRFLAAFQAGVLTSATMRDRLQAPQIVAVLARDGQPDRHHGLGFGLGENMGHPWVGHNGGTLGVNVEIRAYPKDGVAVVIMANRDPPMANALLARLLPFLFGGKVCAVEAVR